MIYSTPELYTRRLILKRGCFDDFCRVYEYNFAKLRDICGEFEMVKQSREALKIYDTFDEPEEDILDWLLYLRDTGEPIGNLVADRIDRELNAMELSFNLHPAFWGQEYMMEACIAAMDYIFSLGFDNILCGYSEGNKKSRRVGEKLGFEPYAVHENAWQKNGIPVTDYTTILSKKAFYERHPKESSIS